MLSELKIYENRYGLGNSMLISVDFCWFLPKSFADENVISVQYSARVMSHYVLVCAWPVSLFPYPYHTFIEILDSETNLFLIIIRYCNFFPIFRVANNLKRRDFLNCTTVQCPLLSHGSPTRLTLSHVGTALNIKNQKSIRNYRYDIFTFVLLLACSYQIRFSTVICVPATSVTSTHPRMLYWNTVYSIDRCANG